MIKSLRLVNFKNFADETLRVGPFTVIVGANASGKSNIRDAFRFLHGIGRGYTLAEIIGGHFGVGGLFKWEPIRGAVNEIVRFGQEEFSLEIKLISTTERVSNAVKNISYTIQIHRNDKNGRRFRVTSESLTTDSGVLYKSVLPSDSAMDPQEKDSKLRLRLQTVDQIEINVASDRPGLSQLATRLLNPLDPDNPKMTELKPGTASILECLGMVMRELERIHFLELSPEQMREPSFPDAIFLGGSGEYLPTVLEAICIDPERKKILADWLQELTPMDVRDFEFPRDPSGRVHLQIVEGNGRKVSVYSASDGTLRFLAMLAVLLGPHSAGLYFFEEIDTGIHPARQSLLLELIEKQSAKGKIQVVTTTHSPDLLNLVNDRSFENTSVVYRDEDSEDGIIRPLAELPNARKLRKTQGLGRLLSGGWMETALAFTEGNDDDVEKEE